MSRFCIVAFFTLCAVGLSVRNGGASVAKPPTLDIHKEQRAPRKLAEVLKRGEEVRAGYGDPRLADLGILDVTKPPYSADPTGGKDATDAIQRAVNGARDARMIAFFPAGTYLVSDTIVAAQRHVYGRGSLPLRRDDFPCILRGGTQGGRARIVLADNCAPFGDTKNPRPVLFVASFNDESELQPNISFNQMVVSLDFSLGRGNPGAIALDHQGAQGSVTEDVHVDAEGAFAGFRGVSGSGGSASHVGVRGGRYGLYLDGLGPMRKFAGSQPSPVISRLILEGQTERSILCGTRGPLTLVGATIDGPGIELAGAWREWNGALNIVDSVIRHRGNGPAIRGNRPVALFNVYFKNATQIIALENNPPAQGVDDWMYVQNYAAGPSPLHPVWVNGKRQDTPRASMEETPAPAEDPARPHEWTEPFPTWQDASATNVKMEPYNAKGNGESDDTDAIQKALDENRDVFLPKGRYRISRPLRLNSNNRFFGLGVYSSIEPIADAPAFADTRNPNPVLATPDNPDATCAVAFLQVVPTAPGSFAVHWQAGRHSMVRNVRMKPWPAPRNAPPKRHPFVLIDGNGGGRWYNMLTHYRFPQTPDHRHVMVRGTRQPLAFYMLNPEHSNADHMVEFDDVQNLNVYAVKSETLGANGPRALTPVLIRNSSDFRVFGHGGNACAPEGEPLYRIENCSNFLLTNFTYQLFREGADPKTWFMVEEARPDGSVVRTPATEHFVWYERD